MLIAGVAALCCMSSIAANETGGTVCLGENLSKPPDDQTPRLYLTIDDSPPIHFEPEYRGPRIVAAALDRGKPHVVKVYFDDQVVESFKLDFRKLKADGALLWRGPGAWRLEAIAAKPCRAATRAPHTANGTP